MEPQAYSWTCSVCTYTWVINATGTDPTLDRYTAGEDIIGHPECVNSSYGLMSSQCMIDAFSYYGLNSREYWLTFDEAWALAGKTTGGLSGGGWYHWVGIRGQSGSNIWIANSAPGYKGVWDELSRSQFNSLGPFKAIALVP